jgi:hypothetical protein
MEKKKQFGEFMTLLKELRESDKIKCVLFNSELVTFHFYYHELCEKKNNKTGNQTAKAGTKVLLSF